MPPVKATYEHFKHIFCKPSVFVNVKTTVKSLNPIYGILSHPRIQKKGGRLLDIQSVTPQFHD